VSSEEPYAKAFPFDKGVSGMPDPWMSEDTAKFGTGFYPPKASVITLESAENQGGDQIPTDDPRDEEKGEEGVDGLYPPLRGWVALHGDRQRRAGSGQAT
jgi:hypothetical protein